jgi:hypothetical protein
MPPSPPDCPRPVDRHFSLVCAGFHVASGHNFAQSARAKEIPSPGETPPRPEVKAVDPELARWNPGLTPGAECHSLASPSPNSQRKIDPPVAWAIARGVASSIGSHRLPPAVFLPRRPPFHYKLLRSAECPPNGEHNQPFWRNVSAVRRLCKSSHPLTIASFCRSPFASPARLVQRPPMSVPG